MGKELFFTTTKQEIEKIKRIVSEKNEELNEENDQQKYNKEIEIEKKYYDETINYIDYLKKHKSTSWRYWDELYGDKDFDVLAKEPYFGSINIKNQGRIYIGKQTLYDHRNNQIKIFDWRSSFGAAYYAGVKNTFIEKRSIELLDIRKYHDNYHYVNILSDYSDKIAKDLKLRKSGYLAEILTSIDHVQNEIIRKKHKKIEVIEGGPGTGKTTIGLYILSYKSYYYVEKNKQFLHLS